VKSIPNLLFPFVILGVMNKNWLHIESNQPKGFIILKAKFIIAIIRGRKGFLQIHLCTLAAKKGCHSVGSNMIVGPVKTGKNPFHIHGSQDTGALLKKHSKFWLKNKRRIGCAALEEHQSTKNLSLFSLKKRKTGERWWWRG
jgi:hypothetical protein